MGTEDSLSLDLIGQALTDMGPQEAVRVAAMPGARGQNMVHRLVGSSIWVHRLGQIFDGKAQELFAAGDINDTTPLMKLIDRDAEENELWGFLDASQDPGSLVLQPEGPAAYHPGYLPLIRAIVYGKSIA